MTRLRVLASVFTCCPPGKRGFTGGESLLGWNLLKQIARFHEVWAITHEQDRVTLDEAVQEEALSNIHFEYVALPSWLRPLLRMQGGHQLYYYLWQLKAYFVARSLHKRVGFHIFHHITYANDWMVSFIGALLPIPYVRGPGGGAHRTPQGFEGEYPSSGRLWEKIRSCGQWLFRHDPLFTVGQARAQAILACNRESMANVSPKWSSKVQFFPVNGVSSQDLALAQLTKPKTDQFRVLSAGSLIWVKGFGLAIKAFKDFSDSRPDAEFCIVGSGPEERRLKDIVGRLQIEDKVKLVQSMPRDQLLMKMASCDVFLFPSLRDGGGAVVVEAMAAGKPVVCLDVGGPGMHVTEDCGMKITPESPQQAVRELGAALESLYSDEILRLRLGKAARKRAEAEYHWNKLGEKMANIYSRAVARAVECKAGGQPK